MRFDVPRLGSIDGLRGVHLQCHIGTDTLSLARLGAQMTGLDFSGESLAQARTLASRAGADITYHEALVYDAVSVLGAGSFDFVYTGIGALCWLPSIARWAEVVAALLRPGGRLFIREGHPMLWAHDETRTPPSLGFPYFETTEPMVFNEQTTYVDTEAPIMNSVTHSWNHSLGEIMTALLENGMNLTGFEEHDSVPWNAMPGYMTRDSAGEWRLTEAPNRLAASYTLRMTKAGG